MYTSFSDCILDFCPGSRVSWPPLLLGSCNGPGQETTVGGRAGDPHDIKAACAFRPGLCCPLAAGEMLWLIGTGVSRQLPLGTSDNTTCVALPLS